MGSCVSSGLSPASSSAFNNVRVVHLNGYVEDFIQPVSVSQVTGSPPKHIVCTTLDLLSSSNLSKPLKGDTRLQPGQVYFKLPYSALQTDFSPLDLALLAKRLTAIAKTTTISTATASRVEEKKPRLQASRPLASHLGLGLGPNGRRKTPHGYGSVRTWKPILDTIIENSFSQRSDQ